MTSRREPAAGSRAIMLSTCARKRLNTTWPVMISLRPAAISQIETKSPSGDGFYDMVVRRGIGKWIPRVKLAPGRAAERATATGHFGAETGVGYLSRLTGNARSYDQWPGRTAGRTLHAQQDAERADRPHPPSAPAPWRDDEQPRRLHFVSVLRRGGLFHAPDQFPRRRAQPGQV